MALSVLPYKSGWIEVADILQPPQPILPTHILDSMKASKAAYIDQLMQAEQERVMATYRREELERARDLVRLECPSIYNNPAYHAEFDQRFIDLLKSGAHPEEAAHRAVTWMTAKNKDLVREEIARKRADNLYVDRHVGGYGHPDRNGYPYDLGHADDASVYGMITKSQMAEQRIDHLMSSRKKARVELKQIQAQEQIRSAMEITHGIKPLATPKKKHLSFIEQIQADVTEWLKPVNLT